MEEIKKFDEMFEHHLYTREDQISYICDHIGELNDDEIEYIYNHIEVKLGETSEIDEVISSNPETGLDTVKLR